MPEKSNSSQRQIVTPFPEIDLLTWLFFTVAGTLLLWWLSRDLLPPAPDPGSGRLLLPLAFDLSAIVVTAVLARRAGTSFARLLGRPRAGELALALGLALALTLLSRGTVALVWLPVARLAPDLARALLVGTNLGPPGGWWPAALLSAVLLGPVGEELLFRGVALHAWTKRFGVTRAVLRTSVLFSCLHADPLGMLALALAACLLVLRGRGLWSAIVLHALVGGLAFWIRSGELGPLGPVLGLGSAADPLESMRQTFGRDLALFALGALALAALWRPLRPFGPWHLETTMTGTSADAES